MVLGPPRVIIDRHTGKAIRLVKLTLEQSESALEYLLKIAIQKDPGIIDRFTELEQAAIKRAQSQTP